MRKEKLYAYDAFGRRTLTRDGGGSAMYLGTDVMGSVRSVTDGYGAVESLRGYDIFGTPYDVSAGGSDFSGAFAGGVAYGYAGKQYDTVTGMYDYGFRDYSPSAARFTTPDPIRDGRNWFSYVNNDPVNYVDLWGLMASDVKLSTNTLAHINQLHPDIRKDVTSLMTTVKAKGIKSEITFSYRSREEQDKLYNIGRNEKGEEVGKVVTYAKGGQSYHNFGLAFDLDVYTADNKKNWDETSDDWKTVIEEAKALGFTAGAEWSDFKDLPHFEKDFGYKTGTLRWMDDTGQTTGGFVNVK